MTPVYVVELDGGYAVTRRDGSVVTRSSSLTEALDACLPLLEQKQREAILRESGTPVGEWRWLDASGEESAADFPDGHIDAVTIEEMADALNVAPMPVPIDGGAVPEGMLPSPVHGMARDSGTPANGWAHTGVPVLQSDGSLHLYLRGELWPTVAAEFDRGRIAFGSVLVDARSVSETGALRGARLMGHALTNNPANRQLTPSTAVRSESPAAVVLRSRPSLLRKHNTMAKKKTEAAEAVTVERDAERAPANPDEAGDKATDAADDVAEGEAGPDKDKMISDLELRVAELSAQVDALRTEAEARAVPMEDPEKKAEEEKARAEREAVDAVDAAIAAGRVLKVAREKWLTVARSSVATFNDLTKDLRAVPAKRQAKAAEGIVSQRALDKDDPFVVALRAAGLSDTKIAAQLAARTKEI